ncbi:hypothetical protein [Umezawaea tangerina]|uniref:LppA-like lipoprotein n=1 Tax=Umezawaea tangerina TaxID=84725 RepID=A0A2T0T2L0_9PSEU|nr:hypothetical protein [Umezawaea tangerina]PRY39892.1 hypothetical protein CLV43_107479 [Umezawaea tangerina]
MKTPVLLAALLALTACSAQAPKASEVASLSTPANASASAGASASAAAKEERPRERLDMTPEDFEALQAPWRQCMAEHGMDQKGRAEPGRPEPAKEDVDKALVECESKDPLPPWEKDSTNPEAVDFANRVVQCLREKGVRYVEVVNEPGATMVSYAFGGPNNDPESITLGLDHVKECEIASSAK